MHRQEQTPLLEHQGSFTIVLTHYFFSSSKVSKRKLK